ncbi:uncharacterized protein CBL_07415 [Carabus blaptoides fortunei]
MLVKIQIFVILSAIVALSNSTELPDYIKTCRRDDPNLNECFKNSANLALKSLHYGDENLGIPNFSGVSIFDTLTLQPLKELPFSLIIKNCKIYGLEKLSLTNVKMLSKIVLILSVAVLGTGANELPPYISTCRQNDPNLNECVKTNANLALETLQYGDKSLNLPKLEGIYFFDSITVNPLKYLPFSLVMKNGRGYGIDNLRVIDAK